MISGSIGKFGKFRLWRNQRNSSFCKNTNDEVVFNSDAQKSNSSNITDLVIEVMIPRGARVLYGQLGIKKSLFGAEIIRTDEFDTGSNFLAGYERALVADFDSVFVGLSQNYAKAAIRGFKRALINGVKIELNQLQIFYAAYGEVSSNEQIFEKMGFALTNLIAGSCDANSEVSINLLFEDK